MSLSCTVCEILSVNYFPKRKDYVTMNTSSFGVVYHACASTCLALQSIFPVSIGTKSVKIH